MDVGARITTIPPLEGVGFREFELRLTKGPIAIGEPGDGTYAELYSKDYLVFLDETGRLRVFVSTGSAWAEVSEELYPQPPHPGDQIRHIGACFDQAARLVLAYEYEGQVYIYQWDPVSQQYVARGPFPGVDPVVIQDATIGFYPPDSDVLLLHLSTDRTGLIMRVQRELYNTPREVAVFPKPVLLDQVNAFPYYGQAVGSFVDSPDSTGFAIRTNTYPPYLYEQAGGASLNPPTDWTLIPIVVTYNSYDIATTSDVAPPVEWDYIPLVVIKSWTEVAASATMSPPAAWNYIPIVVIRNLGTEDAASASVTAPTAWNYPLVVVVYNGGVDVAASASVSAPVEWNYFV